MWNKNRVFIAFWRVNQNFNNNSFDNFQKSDLVHITMEVSEVVLILCIILCSIKKVAKVMD